MNQQPSFSAPALFRRRAVLTALAAASWLAGLALLAPLGSWMTLVVAGPLLAALALRFDPPVRRLLRPTVAQLVLGIAAGAAMIAMTHVSFSLLTTLVPQVRTSASQLYDLMRAGAGAPVAVQALAIVLVAASEEILFRGVLFELLAARSDTLSSRSSVLVIVAAALFYALCMVTLGSTLLVLCAFACGVAWGSLRIVGNSLLPPILAHAMWTPTILFLWPLSG